MPICAPPPKITATLEKHQIGQTTRKGNRATAKGTGNANPPSTARVAKRSERDGEGWGGRATSWSKKKKRGRMDQTKKIRKPRSRVG